MALTASEEVQIRELLAEGAELLSLAANEPAILSKLAATKVNLSSLSAASSGNASDLLLTRQGVNDKSITLGLLTQYVLGNGVTPPQFDSDISLATTEFVQRALGNHSGFITSSSALVLTAADTGKYIAAISPSAITLPALSSVPDGAKFTVHVYGTSTGVAVSANGADVIYTGLGTTSGSYTIPVGTEVTFTAGPGATWFAAGTGINTSVKNVDGYFRLPDGHFVQYGISSVIVSGANGLVTFPITFPNNCRSVTTTFVQAADIAVGSSYIGQARIVGAASMTIRNLGPGSAQYHWLAVGY